MNTKIKINGMDAEKFAEEFMAATEGLSTESKAFAKDIDFEQLEETTKKTIKFMLFVYGCYLAVAGLVGLGFIAAAVWVAKSVWGA